jgi:hypothetical protein
MHDELGHEMQVGARVDVVRDACGDDPADARALAALIEPGEGPIFSIVANGARPRRLSRHMVVNYGQRWGDGLVISIVKKPQSVKSSQLSSPS